MEFSYQYGRTMRGFVGGTYTSQFTGTYLDENGSFPIMAMCEFKNGEGEMLTFMQDIIVNRVPISGAYKTVFSMNVDSYSKSIAGAETILKEFSMNSHSGRLTKVTTPKGEVYYGSKGIVFDKDFNPLMYTTVERNISDSRVILSNYKLHLHPQVFLNDTAVLNKAILRKAAAYFLSEGIEIGWRAPREKVSIVVDDGSKFFMKPNKPSINTTSTEFNNLLKDNIEEVLNQLTYT